MVFSHSSSVKPPRVRVFSSPCAPDIIYSMLKSILLSLWLLSASAMAHDISGKWDFAVQLDAGSGTPTFVFKQAGETLTGTYSGLLGDAELTGTVKGDRIEFSFESTLQDQKGKVVYKGTIASDKQMKGEVDYAGLGKGTWTATKK
jgi:hypothetical protein